MLAKNSPLLGAAPGHEGAWVPASTRRNPLDALFRPSSVLVVGASGKRQTSGNHVLMNLRRFGFNGPVAAVHPAGIELHDYATVPSIADVAFEPDVAFISVPASSVAGLLREAKAVGCKAAIVNANGLDAGQRLELQTLSANLGLPFVGPNCMGLINFSDSIPLYTDAIRRPERPGRVALVAQSGSAAITMMTGADVGFSKVITSGNELAIGSADLVSWLAHDDATDAIGIVMESMNDVSAFEAALASLRDAGKPLIVLKVGRSLAGSIATQAHTGALVSAYDSYDAFFRQHGIPTVRDYDELSACLTLMSSIKGRSCGSRIGIVSSSGGQGALASDLASELGLELASLSRQTMDLVQERLPSSSSRLPIDFGGSVGSTLSDREAALAAVLADPQVDALLVVQDLYENLPGELVQEYMPFVRAVARVAAQSDKLLALASCSVGQPHSEFANVVRDADVPILRGAREALVALRSASIARRPRQVREAGLEVSGLPDAEELLALRAVVAEASGPLPHSLTFRLLRAYGVPTARSALARDEDDAVEKAASIGYPVALKIASTGIAHRAEIKGVILDIMDEDGLRVSFRQLIDVVTRLGDDVPIDGFEVQELVQGGVEAIVGFKSEAPFGATMIVGSGGTLAELHRDRAVSIAPVTMGEASSLISQTMLSTILAGYRRLVAPTPTTGLADVLVRLSILASDFGDLLAEGDLNPVMVRGGAGQSSVVDALLVAGPRSTMEEE